MNSAHWVVELKSSVPEDVWARILVALSQDPVLFRSAIRKPHAKFLDQNDPKILRNWSPAQLALNAIHNPITLDYITDFPLKPLPDQLEKKVTKKSTSVNNHKEAPKAFDLAEAGFIALQLREDFRLNPSWQGIEDKLKSCGDLFQPVLACLLGFLPDPLDLFVYINSLDWDNTSSDQIIRAFLSIPSHIEEQLEFLTKAIDQLPPGKILSLVKSIFQHRPNLGTLLAERFQSLLASQKLESTFQYLKELNTSLVGIELNQYQREPKIPKNEISHALKLNRKIQGDLENMLGFLYGQHLTPESTSLDQHNALEALRASVRTDPYNPKYLSTQVSTLLNLQRIEEAQAWLEAFRGDHSHPMIEFQRARLLDLQSRPEEALNAATKALDQLPVLEDQEFDDLALKLVSFFRLHQKLERILPIIRTILIDHPTHKDFLAYLAEYDLVSGNHEEALINASIAYASDLLGEIKENVTGSFADVRSLFIQSLEAAGEWFAAYQERIKLVSGNEKAAPEAFNALANAAMHLNLFEEALDASNKARQLDPKNGESYELCGKAYFSAGQFDQAVDHLKIATRLSPVRVSAWLLLSEAYQENNQPDLALDCLRAATQALPDSYEGHLALAEYCLQNNAPTQAIEPLQKAATLVQNLNGNGYQPKLRASSHQSFAQVKSKISLNLGIALRSVGKLAESERILKQGLEESEGGASKNPELCYAYALSLIGSKKTQEAIPLLECVIETKPDFLPAFLDLAQALLDIENQPEGAEQVIPLADYVLEHTKDQEAIARAQALLAEAYNWVGDPKKAQEYYQIVLNSPIAKSLSWHSRITTGIGKVHYVLNQPDAAIAAFQEARLINPGDPQVYRWLAKAYLAANLAQESFETARQLTQLQPNHLDTVVWYADHCLIVNSTPGGDRIPALQDAVRTLLHYIQKDPSAPEVWLKLGQVHLSDGELKAAFAAFDQLADIPTQTPSESLHKASLLLGAGDALAEKMCWEYAISMYQQAYLTSLEGKQESLALSASQELLQPIMILEKLADAHLQAGDIDAAIEVYKKITLLDPRNVDCFIKLSDLLFGKALPKEALSCLEKALELRPHQHELISKMVWLFLETGDLQSALNKLLQVIESNGVILDADTEYTYRYQAAEISCSLLQFKHARNLLIDVPDQQIDQELLTNYILLQKELDIINGNPPQAGMTEELKTLVDPNHPRLIALKIRLIPCSKDTSEYTLFKSMIEKSPQWLEGVRLSADPFEKLKFIGMLRSYYQAAIFSRQWDIGLKLNQYLIDISPSEPLAYLQQAQALTIQAEEKRFCEFMDITTGAPGIDSISDNAFHQFLAAIEKTLRRLTDINLGSRENPDPNLVAEKDKLIHYWRKRGQAVFQPNPVNVQSFEHISQSKEDTRPLLLAYRNQNDVSFMSRIDRNTDQEPGDLLLLALALEKIKPWEALEALCQAIEKIDYPLTNNGELMANCQYILSRLTLRTGGKNRLGISPLKAIEQAIELVPDQPRWHSFASEILLYGKDVNQPDEVVKQAKEHLETAIQLEPEFSYHHFSLGILYSKIGETEKAYHCFETACSLKPDLAEAWLELARIQFKEGDVQRATISTDRSLRISPDYVDALLLRGDIALISGNPRGALSKAQAILKLEPDYPQALQLQARALNALNRSDEALKIMAKVIPQVDKPLPLELERSQWLSRSADSQEDIDELRTLTIRYPQEPLFKAYLAETLMRLHHKEAAVVAARQALGDADLGLPIEHQSNLHLIIGQLYRENGQLDNAIHHLSAAIETNPANLAAHIELGCTHQERRQYSQAFKAFQGAIHIAPDDAKPYFHAGMALKEGKEYHKAEEMLRKAIELSPGDSSIQRQLGAVVALNLVHNRRSTIYPQQAP